MKYQHSAHYPRILQIEPTTYCNLNCKMCSHAALQEKPHFFPIDLFENLAHSVFPHIKKLYLMGIGEPLTHPHFMKMLKLARENLPSDGHIEFITNITLLNEAKIDEILDIGVNRIITSLDTPFFPKLKRFRAGISKAVYENLEYLADQTQKGRLPSLYLECIITKSNMYDLGDLVSYCEDIGIKNIVVSHILPHAQDNENEVLYSTISCESWASSNKIYKEGWDIAKKLMFMPEVTPNTQDNLAQQAITIRKQIKKTRKYEIDLNPTGIFQNFQRISLYKDVHNIFKKVRYQARKAGINIDLPPIFPKISHRTCPYTSREACVINVYGDVVPCYNYIHPITNYVNGHEHLEQPYVLGNINLQELSEIWTNKKYRDLRTLLHNMPENVPWCGDCPFSLADCFYTQSNQNDCWGNTPGCHECLYAAGLIKCLVDPDDFNINRECESKNEH